MSSLIPGAETDEYRSSSRSRRGGAGRGAVPVRVDDQLGPAAQGAVGDRVHVADDHVRLHPRGQQRVRPAVDADEHRLEVAHVGPNDRQVALVARTAGDDERVLVAEARLERREFDALGESRPSSRR